MTKVLNILCPYCNGFRLVWFIDENTLEIDIQCDECGKHTRRDLTAKEAIALNIRKEKTNDRLY